jgi:hypothetical protein
MLFGAFSSGTSYQLQSYGFGSGGSNAASGSTYHLQGSLGEQASGSSSGTTYAANNGSIQAEQLNIPAAPTLSNGGGTYYNQLTCVVHTSGNPSDATYAIAINTTNNFSSTNYIQADGTIGASAVYQTYSAWGGSGGFQIVGLTSSTTYYVKAAAMEGQFTNTELSTSSNSGSTVAPTLSFSLSPGSSNLSSITPGTVATSSNITLNFSTNGASGGSVYIKGVHAGFYSTSQSYLVSAVSADLSSQSQGFGIQASSPSQTSGGPLTLVSPFNGTGNVVGAESTSFLQILTSSAALAGGSATANVKVKVTGTAPAVSDYAETFTFIASASF